MATTVRPDAGPEPRPAEPTLDDLLDRIAPGTRLGLNHVARLRVDGVPDELLAAVFAAADRRHLDSHVADGWLTIEPDPAAQAELETGWSPFTGPITAQDGTVVVPEGETPSVETIEQMDYFVQGVTGTVS